MKSWMFLLLIATLCFALPCAGQVRATDAEIRGAIAHLDNDSIDSSLKTFYTNPYRSTDLLIADLRVTRRGRYHNHPHLISTVTSEVPMISDGIVHARKSSPVRDRSS